MLTVINHLKRPSTNKSCLSAIAIKCSVSTCYWFFGFLFIVQKALLHGQSLVVGKCRTGQQQIRNEFTVTASREAILCITGSKSAKLNL